MSRKISYWSAQFCHVFRINNPAIRRTASSIVLWLWFGAAFFSSASGQTLVGTIFREKLAVGGLAVYEKGNKLCVFDTETSNLLIYDGKSLTLEMEIDISALLGPTFSYIKMIVHEAENILYFFANISSGAELKVLCVNLINNSISKTLSIPAISTFDCIHDPVINKFFLREYNYPYKVRIYDLGSGNLTSIIVKDTYCVYNPVTHELIFSFGSEIWSLNGVTGQLSFEYDTGQAMEGMVINWRENKVCFLTSTPYDVWIYDRDNQSLKQLDDLNDSMDLYYNPGSNTVYTSAEIACRSTVVDGITDNWFYLPMEGGAPTMLFRHDTKHAYFVSNHFIGVYDEITQMFEKIFLDKNPNDPGGFFHRVIDQTSGRIYLSKGKSYYPPYYNPVMVIQDTEMMIRPNVLLGGRYSFSVLDPENHGLLDYWYTSGEKEITYNPSGGRAYAVTRSFYGGAILSVHAGSGAADKTGSSAGNFNAMVGSFKLDGQDPIIPVVSMDGTIVYVTCSAANLVKVMDVRVDSSLKVIKEIAVGTAPWGASLTPDGTQLYVANKGSDDISVINTASGTVTRKIAVGDAPWGIAFNPGGTLAYVANSGSATVSVIDAAAGKVTATIPVESNPHWISFSPDGKFACITNNSSGSVSLVDAGIHQVIKTIKVGTHPEGICYYPDGSRIYVATETGASIINTANNTVTSFTDKNNGPYYSLAIANPASRFAGRVQDQKGKPVANVLVRAYQEGVEKGRAATNAAGDFCIFYLQKGTYDLELSGPDFPTQQLLAQETGAGQTRVLHFSVATQVKIAHEPPKQFSLSQNYPNPFNSSTKISFSLPVQSLVTLSVYDRSGRQVSLLVNEMLPAGQHFRIWTATAFPSGIYLCKLRVGDSFFSTKKLTLIR